MSDYIHGGTDAREVARLEKQARFVGAWSLRRFDAPPGARVLDLATGVGAMAGELWRTFPGIRLVGLDSSPDQLSVAKANHPEAAYVRADGSRMPFRDGTFDRVHCTWLLEHVRKPVDILMEVRRVLRVGGYCQFLEVDNATFRTRPEIPEVVEVMRALNEAQLRGGGDPYVGQKLEAYLRQAGFSRVEVERSLLRGDASDPAFFRAFAVEFAEIFESVDEALPQMAFKLHEAANQLRALVEKPGASMEYRGALGQAWK